MFKGKTLLITGGTGSFGKATIRKFLGTDISEIRIFSRDEKKQDDMRRVYNDARLKYYIGDVRRYDSIHGAMHKVDYVFHAAALKQVPSCEFYPMEALYTNAIGTENVLKAADARGVKNVVVLSTDKAVYPINAMGISKAMMEKIMVAKSRVTASIESTIICGTRYGNVMASRGSVIPLFISQIKNGEPITITDPNMTRFMMSIDEAVDLVEYAFEHANYGDIFVRKAPAATVKVLAEALIKIFDSDSEIKYIGTRHGEKLYETLLTREEMLKAEDCGDYYRIPSDNRDLNYNLYFSEGSQKAGELEDYNSDNTTRLDVDTMAEMLLGLDYVLNELKKWKK